MSSRAFLWRWNLRVARREWRDRLKIFLLIAFGVGLSIGGILGGYHLASLPETDFGNGKARASISGDPSSARVGLQEQGHSFGEVAKATISTPGASELTNLRTQDPENAVTEPLLDLREGGWPAVPGDVALTDGVAGDLDAVIGQEIRLGAEKLTVVGIVENPTNLNDEFALVSDIGALGVDSEKISTEFLVDAEPQSIVFPRDSAGIGVDSSEGTTVRASLTTLLSLVAAVGLLQVLLLASAAFAILGRRRSRQFGLLASTGALPRDLRRVGAFDGIVVGAVGAVVGAVFAVAAAAALLPRMEATVSHRIDFSVPWWTVVPAVVLTILAAGVAAWWPARALARQPVVSLLAADRPRPPSVRRGIALGLAAAAAGTLALTVGFNQEIAVLAVVGVLLALGGLLLLSPALVRSWGPLARRLPLASRMAARGVARYQGRSAAVVSALVLALGIPAAAAVTTSAVDAAAKADDPNLPEDAALVWLPGVFDQNVSVDLPLNTDPADGESALKAVRAAVPGAEVTPIQKAIPPGAEVTQVEITDSGTFEAVIPVIATRPLGPEQCSALSCSQDSISLGILDPETGNEIQLEPGDAWVGTPEIRAALGLGKLPAGALGSTRWVDAGLSGNSDDESAFEGELVLDPAYPVATKLPSALISAEEAAARGWKTPTVGWLVTSDAPLTGEAREAIRDAARDGVAVELYSAPGSTSGVRTAAIAIGVLLGLGILAAAIGLITTELARDLRLLEAIGATRRTSRALSAAAAAILALCGAALAVSVGYLALVPMLAAPGDRYGLVLPWPSLLAILVAFPVLAAAVGWLANRPPRRLARSA